MIIHAAVEHTGSTCTANRSRCKHTRSADAPKKRDRQLAALDLLQEDCPREEFNKYIAQVVPEGVKLWYHQIGTDRIYPVTVTKRTVHAACGPVAEHVPIYVVPDDASRELADVCDEVIAHVRKWGYTNVTSKPTGFAEAFLAANPIPQPKAKPVPAVAAPVAEEPLPQPVVEVAPEPVPEPKPKKPRAKKVKPGPIVCKPLGTQPLTDIPGFPDGLYGALSDAGCLTLFDLEKRTAKQTSYSNLDSKTYAAIRSIPGISADRAKAAMNAVLAHLNVSTVPAGTTS